MGPGIPGSTSSIVTGELLHSFGRKGEGPQEFATAPTILQAFADDPGAVWTWDRQAQRLVRWEPQPLTEYEAQIIQLGDPPVRRITWPRRDRLIGMTNSEERRFTLFSEDGEVRGFRSGPILGSENIPLQDRINATTGPSKPCVWPERGFVMMNFSVGRLGLYDLDAGFRGLADVPFPSEVRFEHTDDGGVHHLWRRNWYYNCTANSEHLFALFSGRLDSAFTYEAASSGRFVHVFDWDGNLLGVLELDRDIRGIEIDEERDVLYGSSVVDSKIYQFDLSQVAW